MDDPFDDSSPYHVAAYRDLVEYAQRTTDPEARNQAFDLLVERFREAALCWAYKALGDSDQAEDAAQEAFLSAYRHLGQLRDPEAFPSWLQRIVRTQANRQRRRKHRPLQSLERTPELHDQSPVPEETVVEGEMLTRLREAIRTLPEGERAVTEGFYVQGQSQAELSEKLNLPLTTVKKRLQYARQRLKRAFETTVTFTPQPVIQLTRA